MSNNMQLRDNERFLIINADDFGMSHSTNQAVMQMTEAGAISSATVMVPCPWFQEAASYCKSNPQANIGIHLTFTSEWSKYKWGPVTRNSNVSSLITKEGYFPRKCEEVELNAIADDIRKEIRNQIELAISMGIKPTHLDNHMGSLYGLSYGNDFLEIIFDFCEEYDLPFRLPKYIGTEIEKNAASRVITMLKERISSAEKRGITILDYLISDSTGMYKTGDYEKVKNQVKKTIKNLKCGVSEIYIHPAFICDELKEITKSADKRQMEYNLFMDEEIRDTIKEENVSLISWKELYDIKKIKVKIENNS